MQICRFSGNGKEGEVEMSREDFDGGYSEWAKEQHKKRVADNPNRIKYSIEQFEKHNIEYV